MAVVGAFVLVGCVGGGGSDGVTTAPIDLGSADGACRAVAQANDLLSSIDAGERKAGEAIAARVWDRSAGDDELANWLRRHCGADA